MPNYCSNSLEISNLAKEEVEKIENDYCSKEGDITVLDFEKIRSTPDELMKGSSPYRGDEKIKEELIRKYGAPDWYEFRLRSWGCKWPPSPDSSSFSKTDEGMEFFFDTPWNPPCTLVKYLSTLFPKATFQLRFSEPGNAFSGEDIFQNGIVLSSHDDPDGSIMKDMYGDMEEEEDDDEETNN